ncbi:MAG: hypothetical protein AAF585_06600, partial [Verrucomicrobiota bacterium]
GAKIDRVLMAARSIGLSEGSAVGLSPSLGAIFFKLRWHEIALVKAFFSNSPILGYGEDDFFIDGQMWVYRIPVTRPTENDWRRLPALDELEAHPTIELVRYDSFSLKQWGGIQSTTALIRPPNPQEREWSDSLWSIGGVSRELDAQRSYTYFYTDADQRSKVRWHGSLLGRAKAPHDFEWHLDWNGLQSRLGETRVLDLGFQLNPSPNRWVCVVKLGAQSAHLKKAQRLAIRRWRSFNPKPPDRQPVENQDLQLRVLRSPGNLLEFVDPGGSAFPLDYSAEQPFARSDARPEIFGDRVIYDLAPSFRRGGATLFAGAEAWLEPDLGLVFLRANPGAIERIELFFKELAKYEVSRVRPMGVACWLDNEPTNRTPDFATATQQGERIHIGTGVDHRMLENAFGEKLSMIKNEVASMRQGIFFYHAPVSDVGTKVEFEARFTSSDDEPIVFRILEEDQLLIPIDDESPEPRELRLPDELGSNRKLCVRFYPSALYLNEDAELQKWSARWKAVFD